MAHPDLCCLCLCSTYLFKSSWTILNFYLWVYTSTNLTPENSKSIKTKGQLLLLKPKKQSAKSYTNSVCLPSPDCPAHAWPIMIYTGTKSLLNNWDGENFVFIVLTYLPLTFSLTLLHHSLFWILKFLTNVTASLKTLYVSTFSDFCIVPTIKHAISSIARFSSLDL